MDRPACRRMAALGGFALALCASPQLEHAAPAVPPASVPSAWTDLGPAALKRAQAEDRLILLVLEVPWSEACEAARATLWNDPQVVAAIRRGFVPVSVRADLRPDLHKRFPAEGFPGISLLLPDATPLYYTPAQGTPHRMTAVAMPPDKLAQLLNQALDYYRSQPAAVRKLASDQETSLAATIKPVPGGDTDEALAWAVAQQARLTFDPERRYFGGPPRVPRFDLIELMLRFGAETDDPWGVLGRAALDTLSSKLRDADGGLHRLALGLDWEGIQPEQLLDRNAQLLELLTLQARRSGRRTDRERAVQTARFITEKLGRADGSLAAALCAHCPNGRDETVLTDAVAQGAAALIRTGSALGEPELTARGLSALNYLAERRWIEGTGLAHAEIEGKGVLLPLHLDDLAAMGDACFAAFEATGEPSWLELGGKVTLFAVDNLLDKSTGALRDVLTAGNAPPVVKRSLFPLEGNMRMARNLIRFRYLADSREAASQAARILRAFSTAHTRVPAVAPAFALAAYEYHFPPLIALITGSRADSRAQALRVAAAGAEHPYLIVRTLDTATDAGRKLAQALKVPDGPVPRLTAQHGHLKSRPLQDPAAARGLLAELREGFVKAEQAKRAKTIEQQAAPAKPPATSERSQ